MDNFSFKGVSSNILGIIVNSLPPITKPTMRVEEIEIDGVDGVRYEDLGYEAYEKAIQITITKNNIDELIDWLNGEGKLILSNESDKYYNAKIINQIDFSRLMKYEPVEVVFKVQPYKYKYREQKQVYVNPTGNIVAVNIGLEKSKPTITITGSGTIEFKIDDLTIFTYTFPENETEVTIDSEKQDAYVGNVLKNRNMLGEFPILKSGKNIITWTGTITKIEIAPNSRWI